MMLRCHPDTPCDAVTAVRARVEKNPAGLRLRYEIEGDLGRLRIPPPRAARVAEQLWQHTCCELFVRRAGSPAYREYNFSPSGEWAAYEFERYREGALLADAALDPKIALRRGASGLELEAGVAAPGGKLALGLSAVIEEEGGQLSYWAMRHAPGKPDFHHLDAFALELDEVRH